MTTAEGAGRGGVSVCEAGGRGLQREGRGGRKGEEDALAFFVGFVFLLI